MILETYCYKTTLAGYRRRGCVNPECGFRFSTLETIAIRNQISVVKNNGTREAFDRDKIERSMKLALVKRNISDERFVRIINGLIHQIDKMEGTRSSGCYLAVTTKHIGLLCLATLKELDEVAYIRYASVFWRFHGREDFVRTVENLEREASSPSLSPALDTVPG